MHVGRGLVDLQGMGRVELRQGHLGEDRDVGDSRLELHDLLTWPRAFTMLLQERDLILEGSKKGEQIMRCIPTQVLPAIT